MDDPMMTDLAFHNLLERAIGEPPPSTVDIELARRQGGRRRHRRRVYAPATTGVAAAAAIALIALGLRLAPGTGQLAHDGGTAPGRATALVAHPPRSLSLSAPYASFGWLPAGFSAIGPRVLGDPDAQSAQSESIWASNQQPDGKTLSLQVYPAGQCRLVRRQYPAYSRQRGTGTLLPGSSETPRLGLDCGGVGGSSGPLVTRAPGVSGGRAFWDQNGNLNWEYGPGAWAQLVPSTLLIEPHLDPEFDGWYNVPARPRSQHGPGHPAYQQSAATRALLLKVAAAIHYGGSTGQLYGFTLRDVPASWRAAAVPVSFAYAADGRIVNTTWQAGPASDTQGLSISVGPPAGSCKLFAGESRYVTVDGVRAALRTIDTPGKHNQDLCVPDVHGLAVDIDLDLTVPGTDTTPLPDSTGFGSAVAVFDHLRLLGANPASWTTRPLG
jgi:hypothetical protein